MRLPHAALVALLAPAIVVASGFSRTSLVVASGFSRTSLVVASGFSRTSLVVASGFSRTSLIEAQENLGTYEDRIAVEDVMARYVWAVDSLDAESYVAVFTEDAVIDSNGSISKGHDAIRRIVTGLIQRRDDNKAKGLPTSNLYHVISNVRITFPKAGEAVHQSYWQTVRRDTDGRMTAAAMGRSEDHLVKRNGRWLIRMRTLTVFTD